MCPSRPWTFEVKELEVQERKAQKIFEPLEDTFWLWGLFWERSTNSIEFILNMAQYGGRSFKNGVYYSPGGVPRICEL